MDPHAFDAMPFGLCLLSADYRPLTCVYANDAFLSATGFDIQTLKTETLSSLWRGGDIGVITACLMSDIVPPAQDVTFAKDGATYRATAIFTQEHYDGRRCYALWLGPATKDDGTPKEATPFFRPSSFLATVSHEIRAPMQTVFGLLELMEQERSPQETAAMARTAKDAAADLLEILDDVLDFARMDADQLPLDEFEVPVRTLVRGVLEAMAIRATDRNIALTDDIAPDVPAVVSGDPKRLRQILINLAGNAIKFTREGSVIIRVSALHERQADGIQLKLRFEVVDTGIGMSRAHADSLFSPFSQGEGSGQSSFGGAGLGLSICRKLIHKMGGQIGVETAPGEGSNFWFDIPVEEISLQSSSDPSRLPSLEGISVLSVEDHPLGAREIVKSLRSMGAQVESCPTVAEALDRVRARAFDVGLIDQGLPDGTGIALIREIMRLQPFMALAMYTARSDAGLLQSLQSLGVSYVAKPASRAGLGMAVRDAANAVIRPALSKGARKLLIAEDIASVRHVLARQLSLLKVEADFAGNGEEALKMVDAAHYSLVMTDIHMPDLDGYALAKALHVRTGGGGEQPLIVAFTADLSLLEGQTYRAHGFDECLLKPVSLNQMRRFLIRHGFLEDIEGDEANSDNNRLPSLPAGSGALRPAIDRDAIGHQMGDFDEEVIEMLKLFIDMTRPQIVEIETAETCQDWKALEKLAHSLKGAARSACLNALGTAADVLQHRADKRQDCNKAVKIVKEEFDRAAAEVALL